MVRNDERRRTTSELGGEGATASVPGLQACEGPSGVPARTRECSKERKERGTREIDGGGVSHRRRRRRGRPGEITARALGREIVEAKGKRREASGGFYRPRGGPNQAGGGHGPGKQFWFQICSNLATKQEIYLGEKVED